MFVRQFWRPARMLHRFGAPPPLRPHPHQPPSLQPLRRYAQKQEPQKRIDDDDEPSNIILYAFIGGAGLMFGYMALRGGKGQLATGGPPALSPIVEKDIFGAMFKYQFFDPEQGFVSLPLEKSEIINHNTKKLSFKFEGEKMRSGLPVASAVIAKYKGSDMEKAIIRPYTPVSDSKQRGTMDFIIKKYPGGKMSTLMHDLQPGQRIDFRGPLPKYEWKPNMHEHIALIAGGTGITPMWQLAHGIFMDPEDKTKVTLVLGNVTEEDILLRKEFAELENTYPRRFKAFYVLDNPPEKWQGGKGFITKELLKTVLPEPKEGEKIKIFVCGPPGMYKAISGPKKSVYDQGEVDGLLKDLGYSKDQVFKF